MSVLGGLADSVKGHTADLFSPGPTPCATTP